MTIEEIREVLGDRHTDWVLRHPYGLALARERARSWERARSCTIKPSRTRPAYAALVELLTDVRERDTKK